MHAHDVVSDLSVRDIEHMELSLTSHLFCGGTHLLYRIQNWLYSPEALCDLSQSLKKNGAVMSSSDTEPLHTEFFPIKIHEST